MKKEVKLVMLAIEVNKLEEGVIMQDKIDNLLTLIDKDSCMMLNHRFGNNIKFDETWGYRPVQPILISDDEIKRGDKILHNNQLSIYLPSKEDIGNESIRLQNTYKIIATSEQIGYSFVDEDTNEGVDIPIWQLQEILDNDGKCFIEMNNLYTGKGMPREILEHKLINNKVIISLNK
jgi:hypothetical protein